MKTRVLVWIGILFILAFTAACQPAPRGLPDTSGRGSAPTQPASSGQAPDTAQLIQQGKQNIDAGDYQSAITDLSQAVQADPKNVLAVMLLGEVYEQLGQLDLALLNYEHVTSLDANNDQAYFRTGNIYMQKKDPASAVTAFSKAIGLNPVIADYYVERSIAYQYLGDLSLSEADARRAVMVSPYDPQALTALCRIGALTNKAEPVLKTCDQAVAMSVDDFEALDARAIAHALSGDRQGAIQDLENAVGLVKDIPSMSWYVTERQGFINALKKGKNPFDPATLKRLAGE